MFSTSFLKFLGLKTFGRRTTNCEELIGALQSRTIGIADRELDGGQSHRMAHIRNFAAAYR